MDEDFETPKSSANSLIVGAVVVALAAGGGYLFMQATAVSFDPAPLLESGVDNTAEIISAQPTGSEFEGEAVYHVELQVSDDGRGYRVFHQQPFPRADHDKLTKTTKVKVKVDPQDKKKLWVTEVGVQAPAD